MFERYFYFFLLIATILFPLAASFDYRVKFVRFWPGLFLGIAFMMLVMIPWDVWFTAEGAFFPTRAARHAWRFLVPTRRPVPIPHWKSRQ